MLTTCFQQCTKLAGVASGDDSARASQPSEHCRSVLLLLQWQSLGRFPIPGDVCQDTVGETLVAQASEESGN
jgi:hypothetical protein